MSYVQLYCATLHSVNTCRINDTHCAHLEVFGKFKESVLYEEFLYHKFHEYFCICNSSWISIHRKKMQVSIRYSNLGL